MFNSNSIPRTSLLIAVLFVLFANGTTAIAQTGTGHAANEHSNHPEYAPAELSSANSPQSTPNAPKPEPRRPPALRDVHGSIRGSQANPAADHPLARLLDHFSERNKLDVEIYGYLEQGFTWNPDSPVDRTNGPVLNNYRSNAYQMNGIYLVAERKVDSDRDAIQLGGRLDQLYGTDAAFALTTGFDENIVSDAASSFYKLAFPQAYANLFLPIGRGTSFKVGMFIRPWATKRPTRPRTFFTHTS